MLTDKAILFEVLLMNYPHKYRVRHENKAQEKHVITLYKRKFFVFWEKMDQLIMDCRVKGWFYEKRYRTVKG